MYRVHLMSGRYLAHQTDIDLKRERLLIEEFTDEGSPVILVNDLSDLRDIGVDTNNVEIVEED